MRFLVSVIGLGITAGVCCAGDLESKIDNLSVTFAQITDEISNTPVAERPKLYDRLREQVSMMAGVLVMYPDGTNHLETARSDKVLIDFVYGVFTSEQCHLASVCRHTADKKQAIELMAPRAKSLISIFPLRVSEDTSDCCSEAFFFTQFLAYVYPYIPEHLADLVRQNMSRWKGDDRVPGLLVLTESGDRDAAKTLDASKTQEVETLKVLFRRKVDLERKIMSGSTPAKNSNTSESK